MKQVLPTPKQYVVAVSGGVDSVVLLHLLAQKAKLQKTTGASSWRLTVAHYDHGIRDDSREDRLFVQDLARNYGLPFVYDEGRLGSGASEAAARQARYAFLRQVQSRTGALAIITAHHQDDVLETAIGNVLRGTGRKGLTSLASQTALLRPLLGVPKVELLAYAHQYDLAWHEDSTNTDQRYARNYIRHRIVTRFDEHSRQQLLAIIERQQELNRLIDTLIINQLHTQSQAGMVDRRWFNQLPHQVAREVMPVWLRSSGAGDFDSRMLERLVIGAKVLPAARRMDVLRGAYILTSPKHLALKVPER